MDGVRTAPEPPRASIFALSVLLLVVLVAPWAMGAVSPVAVRLLTLLSLVAAAGTLLLQTRRGAARPSLPAWPLVAIAFLGAMQLVPWPQVVLRILAPGPARAWFPADPTVAAALGSVWRPISVAPDATAVGLGLWIGLVALAYLAAPAASSSRGAPIAAVAVAFSGAALSVYAIVARTVFGPLLYGRFPVPTVMPFGPFVSKNHFAGYVAMAAVLTLGLALHVVDREGGRGSALSWTESPRAYRVLLALSAALVMVVAVFTSLSRGGLVSLAAGVVTLVALRLGGSGSVVKTVVPLVATALVLIVLLPSDVQRRLGTLVDAPRDMASSFRLQTWRDSTQVVASSPWIGYGMGTFVDALPPFKSANGGLRIEHAENDYLEWLVETGLIGVVLGGFVFVGLFRAARRRLDYSARGRPRALATGALAGSVVLLVQSCVDFTTHIPSNAALFLLAVAMTCEMGPIRITRIATFATGLALLGATAWAWPIPSAPPPTPRGDALAAATIADPVARGLRLSRAEHALMVSLQRRPADAEAWFLMGWVRAAQGRRAEGAALAAHAARLDPQRRPLVDAAAKLRAAP